MIRDTKFYIAIEETVQEVFMLVKLINLYIIVSRVVR